MGPTQSSIQRARLDSFSQNLQLPKPLVGLPSHISLTSNNNFSTESFRSHLSTKKPFMLPQRSYIRSLSIYSSGNMTENGVMEPSMIRMKSLDDNEDSVFFGTQTM